MGPCLIVGFWKQIRQTPSAGRESSSTANCGKLAAGPRAYKRTTVHHEKSVFGLVRAGSEPGHEPINSYEVVDQVRRARRHAFFFNDTATTEIYTLSLHDALPI